MQEHKLVPPGQQAAGKEDPYVVNVIQQGGAGSYLLAVRTQETWGYSPYVEKISGGMGGIAAIHVPETHLAVVFSRSGDPNKSDPRCHAQSLAARLFRLAEHIGAVPIGLSTVVDSGDGNPSLLEAIVDGLDSVAHANSFALLPGENAILGDRVPLANVSGTMVAMVPKGGAEFGDKNLARRYPDGTIIHSVPFEGDSILCTQFDPGGKLVIVNSDGVGTKLEVYERFGERWRGVLDAAAMVADDAARMWATLKVISGVVERTSNHHIGGIDEVAQDLYALLGAPVVFQQELAAVPKTGVRMLKNGKEKEMVIYEGRLRSWDPKVSAYNLNATAVSVMDETRLRNLPRPRAGEYLVVIAGKVEKPCKPFRKTDEPANPRSNGFTYRREKMKELFGVNWHETPFGRVMLEYLARPSTVFYPLIRRLWERGAITAFYHMSGGALEGKLARPLAKEGLFVKMRKGDLLEPHPLEYFFAGQHDDITDAYRKLPLGNDCFIVTSTPQSVVREAQKDGFRAKRVGQLVGANNGRAGVELVARKRTIYFSGGE